MTSTKKQLKKHLNIHLKIWFDMKREEPVAYANGDDDAFKQVPMDDDLPF